LRGVTETAICALGAYLPLVFESGGELVDGLVIVEGLDGHDGDLGVGLAINLGAEIFKTGLGCGSEDSGEVVDIARGRGKVVD
jgi:hypothetical protein